MSTVANAHLKHLQRLRFAAISFVAILMPSVSQAEYGSLNPFFSRCSEILEQRWSMLARERRRQAAQLPLPFLESRPVGGANSTPATPNPIQPGIDARRLINEEDWAKAMRDPDHSSAPWAYYSDQTYTDWASAARWVSEGAGGQEIGENVLREIHRRAMKHHFFTGADNRRTIAADKALGIPLHYTLDKTRRVERRLISELGLDHDQFRGNFRQDGVDALPHRGSTMLGDGSRAFTPEEFDRIRLHPYMTITEGPVTLPDGLIKAKAMYLEPSKVEGAVKETLRILNEDLRRARTAEDVILATNRMIYKMIGIHPFQDGNGRSVRLLADLVYERHGLPPPLFPNERDLEMSESEALDFTLRGMEAYLEARRSSPAG